MNDTKILVIPRNKYTPNCNIKDLVNEHGLYMNRAEAEVDENFLQIIPYIYVSKGSNIFLYKRLKAGSEARLHDKYSIGLGGHVDQEDSKSDSAEFAISHWITVEMAGLREINEELEIATEDYTIDYSGKMIYDDSNPVGRVHLGVVGKCELLFHNDAKVREVHKLEGHFTSKEKIRSMWTSLEVWSQKLLDIVDP